MSIFLFGLGLGQGQQVVVNEGLFSEIKDDLESVLNNTELQAEFSEAGFVAELKEIELKAELNEDLETEL